MKKHPEQKPPVEAQISRRDFTVSAAFAAAALALPADVLAQQEKPQEKPPATPSPTKTPETPEGPKLSDAAKREVEQKIQAIMDRYGNRLSDSQKADVRRFVAQTQEGLETLRAFPIDNSDEPVTVLHFNDTQTSAPQTKGARR